MQRGWFGNIHYSDMLCPIFRMIYWSECGSILSFVWATSIRSCIAAADSSTRFSNSVYSSSAWLNSYAYAVLVLSKSVNRQFVMIILLKMDHSFVCVEYGMRWKNSLLIGSKILKSIHSTIWPASIPESSSNSYVESSQVEWITSFIAR